MLWITNLISITIMRYTKFIALLATMLVSVACFQDDLDFGGERIDTESDIITIYGNVARFADCEVSTRANKTPEESYVSKMALAVFTEDGNECIHYELRDGSNLLYTLDRAKIREKYGDEYDNDPCVMYIFANMPDLPSDGWNGKLQDLLDLAYTAPGLTRPDGGFPMIGSLGDAKRDGKSFVLMPMNGNRMELPKVDDIPTDYLNIPMSAIFAKISFEITVSPDQDVDVHAPARFEMTGYEVHNLPSKVSFNSNKNNELIVDNEVNQPVNPESVVVAISGIAQGGDEGSGSKIEFDFYLPERLVTPETSAEAYTYPLGENGAPVTGYSQIPAKNKKYAQRYKPKLLGKDQNGEDQTPTYITIKGKYRDHHEQYYGVEYDIYLGADNYGDFNIVRNNQYYNKLNIKGIASSNDQTTNSNSISIDHRVNVDRTSSPLIVSIRRETQLDAHYEVRPMRLRISGDVPDGAKVVVEVLDENGDGGDKVPTWVRLEKSGTTGDHITTGVSAGKRKYFTTDLVTKTLKDNYQIEVSKLELSTTDKSTVWIYVDEADPAEATETRTTRSATIRVTYSDNNKYKESEGNQVVKDYHISQYNLHEITGTSGQKYYIEQYEEYLYNYDSEDSYGQIREEGLRWGLEGEQLSNKYKSFNPDIAGTDWQSTYTDVYPLPVYDFYVKHDRFVQAYGGTLRSFRGRNFTNEIATTTKDKANGVKHLTMGEQPKGAVEYCYNRNKRNSNGSIDTTKLVWYLPSADELEDFIVPAFNYYKEFQENFYWTSQPAYIRNVFYYEKNWREYLIIQRQTIYAFTIYEDNVDYARATKIIQKEGNLEPILSGLDSIAYKADGTIVDNRGSWDTDYTDHTILGYYHKMRHYRKPNSGGATVTDNYTKVPDGQDVSHLKNYDSWYTETSTEKKYYVPLGHLYNLMQEGYLPRTESHRVRCVRKVDNN